MDDPIQDCRQVIHTLTQGSPKEQENCVNTYCTPNFSFIHPFCRTGSYEGSRLVYLAILRWYKIMSPTIELNIHSVAFDETNLILYVTLSQLFAIWFIPFHRSPVTLTTVLQLSRNSNNGKYYLTQQNDLYQVDQFVRFFAPWGIGITAVYFWHFFATIGCVILAFLGAPVTWAEQAWAEKRGLKVQRSAEKREAGRVIEDVANEVRRRQGGGLEQDEGQELLEMRPDGADGQFGGMKVVTT